MPPEALSPPFLSDKGARVRFPESSMSSMDVLGGGRTPLLSGMNAMVRPRKPFMALMNALGKIQITFMSAMTVIWRLPKPVYELHGREMATA